MSEQAIVVVTEVAMQATDAASRGETELEIGPERHDLLDRFRVAGAGSLLDVVGRFTGVQLVAVDQLVVTYERVAARWRQLRIEATLDRGGAD